MVTAAVCSSEGSITRWGAGEDTAFSPSVAGFLGQFATQRSCTASWANISLEVSSEEMESPRKAKAPRCLGGQIKKGGIALHQVTGSICLVLPTKVVGRKWATRGKLLSSLLV